MSTNNQSHSEPMNMECKFVCVESLIGGDIILCYGDGKKDLIAKGMEKVTGSKYKHAAICLDNEIAAESVISGVQEVIINELINRYSHVAVFRHPDAWSTDRLDSMKAFIDAIIVAGAKYNMKAILAFTKKKAAHEKSLHKKLEEYFNGLLQPDNFEKGKYFCSELVVDCLVATGFIDPSAAIMYKSDTYSPGSLGCDPTFGTFFGYIRSSDDYMIPSDDEFANHTSYGEIFKNK